LGRGTPEAKNRGCGLELGHGSHGGGALCAARARVASEVRASESAWRGGRVSGTRSFGRGGWECQEWQWWPELCSAGNGADVLCVNREGQSAEEGGE
jgi:hypothetical protein